MYRSIPAALALLVAGVSIAPAVGGDQPVRKAWAAFCRDFKRNNCWPDPFVVPDRMSVWAALNVQTANGWQMQNTIQDYHFEDDSEKLTEAGKLKVEAILRNTPVAYRTVFVLRSDDPKLTAERIETVQQYANSLAIDGGVASVMETNVKPRGTSAYYVDEVTKRYQSSTPTPRLPEDGDSSDSSSAGDLPE